MDTKSLAIGLILITVGALLLADNLNYIYLSWGTFWPWLLLGSGAVFCLAWLKDRTQNGLLIPGITFLVYGGLFWYCANFGWWRMGDDNLWAFFLIGPGLGFLAMYFFGSQEKPLLIPAGILTGLGVVFLSGPDNLRFVWPIALIIIGFQLLRRGRSNQEAALSRPDSAAISPPDES